MQKPITDFVLVIASLIMMLALLGLFDWPNSPNLVGSLAVIALAAAAIVMLFVAAWMLLQRLRAR